MSVLFLGMFVCVLFEVVCVQMCECVCVVYVCKGERERLCVLVNVFLLVCL